MAIVLLIPNNVRAESKKATVVNPETGHRMVMEVGTLFPDGYVLEVSYGYEFIDDDMLGFSVASSYSTTLGSSLTSTQNTVPASSVNTKQGEFPSKKRI